MRSWAGQSRAGQGRVERNRSSCLPGGRVATLRVSSRRAISRSSTRTSRFPGSFSSILRKKIKSRRRMRFLQIFVNDELSDVFDYEIISHPRRRMLWPFKIFKY